jgi:uncharacterized phage-associated protein
MLRAKDVAAYILKQHGEMTAMKLQKLLYYSQAWSLVWDEKPLFKEDIQAWANGPVVRNVYALHRGEFKVRFNSCDTWGASHGAVRGDAKDTVDAVLKAYGNKSAQWLSDLTHMEKPWKQAREGLRPGERGENTISHASMAEYYGSLQKRA